jgi:AraC family transcriptional regulator of adaptative response/methylated-DNA-[protein]-cysteine methyltransferase
MTTTLSDAELYDLFIKRAPEVEGRAFAAVTTTGIFCRLTCPAPKPKRENVLFLPSAREAVERGFRPCKRCRPLGGGEALEPYVRDLLDALEADPERKWSEAELRKMGHDPSTVRRGFRRQFGVTFLSLARSRRLRRGVESTGATGAVIEGQLDAGFESPSAFRAAVAKLLGRPPGVLTRTSPLRLSFIDTPLGPMIAVATEGALHLLEFADRKNLGPSVKAVEERTGHATSLGTNDTIGTLNEELSAYFEGRLHRFSVEVADHGPAFFTEARRVLAEIPAGTVWSYRELAAAVGRPAAARAVARANATNRLAIILPCHRVTAADGSLSGYAGGVWRKRWLIDHEAKHFRLLDKS